MDPSAKQNEAPGSTQLVDYPGASLVAVFGYFNCRGRWALVGRLPRVKDDWVAYPFIAREAQQRGTWHVIDGVADAVRAVMGPTPW